MRGTASGFSATRPALPLGLTLGLHLLLVLAWLMRPAPPAQDGGAGLVSVLIPVLAPQPRVEAAARASRPVPPRRVPEAVAPPPSIAEPARSEPEPDRDAVTAADPFAGAPPTPPPPNADSDLLGRARRAAGPIDRALRGGRSEVPKEADTPWARLRRAADAAHAAPIFAEETRDRYTSPDGVVIYRARQGKRQTCRQTGSVNFLPGGARGANSAGDVPCPKGAEWDRY